MNTNGPTLIRRIWLMLLAVGPGIFCIGYTIGTGSVTTMAVSGSRFGTGLLWVLALSCFFSWVLMEAYGRYALVTNRTSIYSFKTQFRFGKIIAITVAVGVVMGQWCALSGIVGLSANALYETLRLFVPQVSPDNYWAVLGIAAALMLAMYLLILVGRYSFFEKLLVVFVMLMGISFVISMFIVLPSPTEIVAGFVPRIPQVPGAKLMVAAFVGTTMAAPTFVVRPLLVKTKGWTIEDMPAQRRDALIAAMMMFLISSAIMVCATGALFHEGKSIEKVLDMVHTLQPVAGRFAVAIFLVGTLSAGLSSVFPIIMVAPLLISDYRAGRMETQTPTFRILAGLGCLVGLTVPILGVNPIAAQIATQVSQVFVLPLVVLAIFNLVNRKECMGTHKAGPFLNLGLLLALAFSCVMSYNAILALKELFYG